MTALQSSEGSLIRWQLRTASADLHARVDARLSGLLADGAAGYIAFLRLSAAAILPLERALMAAAVSGLLPDWEERSRSRALLADLADFSQADPAHGRPPTFRSEAQMFGVLYVLEGSRLGAQLIVRQMLADGGAVSRTAMRFLRHGEGRQFWPTFLQRLEASEAVRDAPDAAIEGARAAFAWFCAPPEATSAVNATRCAEEASYA